MPQSETEQAHRPGALGLLWALPPSPISPPMQCTGGDVKDERRTGEEGHDSIFRAPTMLHESHKAMSEHREPWLALNKLQTSALIPIPSSAAYIDPFATSAIPIDGEMADLLRLCRSHPLPCPFPLSSKVRL